MCEVLTDFFDMLSCNEGFIQLMILCFIKDNKDYYLFALTNINGRCF